MLQTFEDQLHNQILIASGCSITFNNPNSIYYLNGTIKVLLFSVAKIGVHYECQCVSEDGYFYVTTPNKLYVNKFDTKAAKLLYLKE